MSTKRSVPSKTTVKSKKDVSIRAKPDKVAKSSTKDNQKLLTEKEKSSKVKEKKSKKHIELEKSEKKIKKVKEPPPPPSPSEDNYYSDDFEDYDSEEEEELKEKQFDTQKTNESAATDRDGNNERYESDFEEDSEEESEVESVPLERIQDPTPLLKRLVDREHNQISNSEQSLSQSKEQFVKIPAPAVSRPINFTSATLNPSESVPINEKRLRKLQELIKFDHTRTILLNTLPNKEHDFYLKLFGATGKKQGSAQTNDDDMHEMTQTEQNDVETKGTQFPMLVETLNHATEDESESDLSIFRNSHLESQHLRNFMSITSRIILELTSDSTFYSKKTEMKHHSNLSFSKGFHNLTTPTTFKGRVTAVSKQGTDPDYIFVSIYIRESIMEDLIAKSLICEYSIDNSTPPKNLFLAEGEVTCIVGSPDRSMLCAGLKDGSVLVYNRLEKNCDDTESIPWLESPQPLPFVRPDFNTSYYSSEINGTSSSAPVVDIAFINSTQKRSSEQLVVLDQSARLWVYSCHRNSTLMMKGMSPGAYVFLTLSALIRPDSVVSRNASIPTSVIANCLTVSGEPAQFIIGTDVGFLTTISKSRVNQHVPRLYKDKTQFFGEITCVEASPTDNGMLLAGLSTGCISVYNIHKSGAITTITPSAAFRKPVVAMEWNPTDPDIFFSVHEGNKLLVWNVNNPKAPLLTAILDKESTPITKITAWKDLSSNNLSYLALGYSGGNTEIHLLELLKK